MFKVIVIFIILFIPFVRFALMNLHNITFYAPVDVYNYFKYKKYNNCPNFGYIKVFCGYFGSGKSLSAVDEVIRIYKHYNGLKVWNDELHAFIEQKITIISNLKLYGVPYYEFISEQQFIDYEAAPSEVVLFLVDEIGTVWNNRDFKNFNPDVFNNIVQSRKRKMAIYGTLPVFQGTDINIRRYTDSVVYCKKDWRFIKHLYFRSQDLENCTNIELIEPTSVRYRFVKDLMYKQYNTYDLIDKLKKDMRDGRLLTFNELNAVNSDGDFKQARLKRKFRKRQK